MDTVSLFCCYVLLCFEAVSHYVAQAVLKLETLPRCLSPKSAETASVTMSSILWTLDVWVLHLKGTTQCTSRLLLIFIAMFQT